MSLRTGREVATAHAVIMNPNNLKIEGFYCTDSLDKQQLILVTQDVRDVLPVGLVINDHSVLSEPEDLIRLKKTMELGFDVIGKTVMTSDKQRIGKVSDYAVEPDSMIIKKLYVTRSLLKSLTSGSVSIDRTQIIEITDKKIVVRDNKIPIKENSPALAPMPAN